MQPVALVAHHVQQMGIAAPFPLVWTTPVKGQQVRSIMIECI
jgi:hypothetical protein